MSCIAKYMKQNRVALITARRLRSSRSSLNLTNYLLDHLDEQLQLSVIIIDNLLSKKYIISEDELRQHHSYVPFHNIKDHPRVTEVLYLEQLSLSELKKKFDTAIITIYNDFGEDGSIQGLLDLVGIPYFGPSLKTSAVCFDKQFTKGILSYAGITVPKGIQLNSVETTSQTINRKIQELTLPLIVKPASSGSSRGTSIVKTRDQLNSAIREAQQYSGEVLVEEFVQGTEYSVGVIGHYTHPQALPVVMIKTDTEFFDYHAKYLSQSTQEICPAPIDKKLTTLLQKTAVKAYKAVKAKSHARIDMIASDKGIFVLEINTFPGLSIGSIFPKELSVVGLSVPEFIYQVLSGKIK